MKNKFSVTFAILVLIVTILSVSGVLHAQPSANELPTASETEAVGAVSATSKTVEPANQAAAAQYTQNDDSRTLEEKIIAYNQQYCPPEAPIAEISEFSLLRLARAEFIKRSELEKYKNMVMVDGKVYEKKERSNEDPDEKKDEDPSGKKPGPAGKNLIGSFETACEELADKKNRGKTEGNRKPERVLELKRRKVTYRDRENQLREMEVYSPPKFPAKKKDIAGKKGKKVKDYATSVLVPKNVDPKDAAAFEEMPSADAWIDDKEPQKQD
ncbi:MAG: hypothetical protein CVV41_14845 [Candidatus Riflebacteria bacterium HGW-Riflebacteria-1]|jgi:hypothetical protein|nr:MAG: hypothetical protein CVV41_14845 [Candidatus Riflebacteria bacterium HGW-Riflebacteria-1]